MKEFVLTQSYATIDEMLHSGEVEVYKEELQQGNIEKYAIVSRIGNRYDLNGIKIDGFVDNPFSKKKEIEKKDKDFDAVEEIEEKILEEMNMKYLEIETFIDNEIAKAIEETKLTFEKKIEDLKAQHNAEIEKLKEAHALELAQVKYDIKAELIAKLNS